MLVTVSELSSEILQTEKKLPPVHSLHRSLKNPLIQTVKYMLSDKTFLSINKRKYTVDYNIHVLPYFPAD